MRVGAIGYATDQGLAHLMRSFYDAGLVTDPVIFKHPGGRPTHVEWYPPETPVFTYRPFLRHYPQEVNELLARVDVVLFWETPFDWAFLGLCRERGVKTALVLMSEWTPERWPDRPDLLIAPSLWDKDRFPESVFLPVPAPQGTWRQRTRARRFLHNAGWIGSRNHKGTEELLRAVAHVKSPFELMVRCQHGAGLYRLINNVPGVDKDPRVSFVGGTTVPYESLFDGFDVYVAPEKYNGLSLPLQEAFAAGLLVMTTDRYPANTWLPKEPLIPARETRKARVGPGYLEFDESMVRPEDLAAVIDAWYDADISPLSARGRCWADENSWENLKPHYLTALEEVVRR